MQEAEILPRRAGQAAPVGARRFQQREGAFDVGANEFAGAMDGAIDVRLGGKMDDGARLPLGQQTVEQAPVADVAAHEGMADIAVERGQVLEVARVGQLVEIDDRFAGLGEPVQHEIGADEPGAAGYQNHWPCLP